jgi:hypothetical protein
LPELLKREEAGRVGIYLLVGEDPEMPSKSRVYVGEGDDVGRRLAKHDKDESKDFWTRVCVITSKDANLTKSHVRYLEARLLKLIPAIGRANVANGNSPEGGVLPEAEAADMEFFLEQVRLVLPVLGFDFLREKQTPQATSTPTAAQEPAGASAPTASNGAGPELVLVDKKHGVEARGYEADGELVVAAGSTARAESVQMAQNSYASLREQLINDGTLTLDDSGKKLSFIEATAFKSPSAAAAVILNRNDNGRRSWKVRETGETLAAWQARQSQTS